jgi:hypothetical protein
MPAPPSQTYPVNDFTLNPHGQANITLSKINVTIAPDGAGGVAWSLTADQYNHTQATSSPNNAYVYIDLYNAAGGVIPIPQGNRIVFSPSHLSCRELGKQVWEGNAYGYPPGDLLASINNVALACETITYEVGPC